MAVGYLPPSLAIFAPDASSLPNGPSPVASCFFAVYIGVSFFCYFYLFGTLCGSCSWGIHSNSPPSRLFCVRCWSLPRPLCRPLSAAKFFLVSPPWWASNATFCVGFWTAHDRLPSGCRYPHSVFFLFLFSCIVGFLSCIFVFPCCCLIFRFIPLFPCTFSFLFLLIVRLYPFSLIYPFLLWFRPWVVDVNDFLDFGLRGMSFGVRILLSGPRNKRYLH